MRHARPEDLDRLETLLVKLRAVDGLKEKKRGLFYRNGKSFLHFHEDPAGLFADVCIDGDDIRLRVSTQAEQRTLIVKIKSALTTT